MSSGSTASEGGDFKIYYYYSQILSFSQSGDFLFI